MYVRCLQMPSLFLLMLNRCVCYSIHNVFYDTGNCSLGTWWTSSPN